MAAYDDNQDGKIEIREVSIINLLYIKTTNFFLHCHLNYFGMTTCQIIHHHTLSIVNCSKAGINDKKIG